MTLRDIYSKPMKTDTIPGYRILVIDDNKAIHEDFRKILMRHAAPNRDLENMESALFGTRRQVSVSCEFSIDCAPQGKEGLELLIKAQSEDRPYALAFVDGRMPPGWDGIETIDRIWQVCPDIQIVLCTAYSDFSWREIQRALGENDSLQILKKPFENTQVLQMAHALTRKWQLNREIKVQMKNLDDLVFQRTKEKEHTQSLLDAALEHSPAGIVIADERGEKIFWENRAAKNILGNSSLALMRAEQNPSGTAPNLLMPDNKGDSCETPPFLSTALEGSIVKDIEVLVSDAEGREKWISTSAAPIRNELGAITAGIVVFQDITERKHSESNRQALQAQLNQANKMEAVGLLAGGIAHDYNNMMSVILGNTELGLRMVSQTDPLFAPLSIIQKAAERSAKLTQQLLGFARKQSVLPKALNINNKISETLGMLQRLIGEDIELVWKPAPELWPVKIDPTQIDQVLINLCVNARDAIAGIGRITIESRNADPDEDRPVHGTKGHSEDYVILIVTDDGPGIPEEHLDRIFDPFFTTKEVGAGTGLGLSSVYGIIKQNKGYIYVDSEPGKGTVFKIFLPRFKGKITEAPVRKKTNTVNGHGEKVLVVEDEEGILDICKSMLERLGYTALPALSPHEAIRLAEENAGDFKLLLTDVIMPKMNGFDLANRLKSKNPQMKCIYMSGYSADITAFLNSSNQNAAFLKKPFSLSDLSSKVSEVLATSE